MTKYLTPHFTTTVDPADFGLGAIHLVGDSMGIERQRTDMLAALADRRGVPILLNCERHRDNAAAAADLLKSASGNNPDRRDLSVYIPVTNTRAWEGAGMTAGGGADRLSEIGRARAQTDAADLWRATHTTIDAWQMLGPGGRGIAFSGMTPMETWRLIVQQRICSAEETRLPVRAVLGLTMLHNGRAVDAEPRVPVEDLWAQTCFLLRHGVEPILMAGWSDLLFDRTTAAKAKDPSAPHPTGFLPFLPIDRAGIEAFAKAK